MSIAFFALRRTARVDVLVPEPVAASGWAADQMRGMAVSGALARAAEEAVADRGRTDLQPARWTLDLFRPARMEPCTATATVVRESARLCLVDVALEQSGDVVARACALFLRPATSPAGIVWSAETRPLPPPAGLATVPAEPRLHYSDDVGWTAAPALHQNSSRKQLWHLPIPVVVGEQLSPFQLVSSVADVTNLVTNWGSEGLAFINADLTLSLARLPVAMELGLAAVDHVEQDGIAVGTAVVYDREGRLGTAVVSAMANPHRVVDMSKRVVVTEDSLS